MEDIIINIITVGIPSATSVLVGFFNYKIASRNSAKHSILQLIMEDRMDWKDGKLTQAVVRSNKGGNCLLRSNTPLKGKGLKKTKETNLYTLSTKAGVAYTIQGL
jgi:hypothetical protein